MRNLHLYGYDAGVDFWEQLGATSVQADKVVNVKISESEHTLLKEYCASLNRSMQDVLRDFALMQIQKQRFFLPPCALLDGRAWDRTRPQSS